MNPCRIWFSVLTWQLVAAALTETMLTLLDVPAGEGRVVSHLVSQLVAVNLAVQLVVLRFLSNVTVMLRRERNELHGHATTPLGSTRWRAPARDGAPKAG